MITVLQYSIDFSAKPSIFTVGLLCFGERQALMYTTQDSLVSQYFTVMQHGNENACNCQGYAAKINHVNMSGKLLPAA